MLPITHTWGHELVWASTELYSSRMLVIKDGEKTPYVYNRHRDKTIFVLQGCLMLVVEGINKMLNEGESYHVIPKIMHRMVALKGDVTLLEVGMPLEDDEVLVEA